MLLAWWWTLLVTPLFAVLAVIGLSVLLFAIPFPLYTAAEGIVWLPEQSQLRAGTDGFVRGILAESGSLVVRGQPLIATEDPLLVSRVDVLKAKVLERRARARAALPLPGSRESANERSRTVPAKLQYRRGVPPAPSRRL